MILPIVATLVAAGNVGRELTISACSFNCSVTWGAQQYTFNRSTGPVAHNMMRLVYSREVQFGGSASQVQEVAVDIMPDGTPVSVNDCDCVDTACAMTVCTAPSVRYHAISFGGCSVAVGAPSLCECLPSVCAEPTPSTVVSADSGGNTDSESGSSATSSAFLIAGVVAAVVAIIVGFALHSNRNNNDDDHDFVRAEMNEFYPENAPPPNVVPPSVVSYDAGVEGPLYDSATTDHLYEVPMYAVAASDVIHAYDNESETDLVAENPSYSTARKLASSKGLTNPNYGEQ